MYDTVAHQLEHTARNYRAAFASRSPRLAKLAAYRTGNTHHGHFPGNDLELAKGDVMPLGGPLDSIVIKDPARQSSSFMSQPRIAEPIVSKAALRATVTAGLPAYQRVIAPGGRTLRSPRYPPAKSPRRLPPIGS